MDEQKIAKLKTLFERAAKRRFCDEDDDISTPFCQLNNEDACMECLVKEALALIAEDRAGLEEIVNRLIDWNKKYPTQRIYSHVAIERIANEMEAIYQDALKLDTGEYKARDAGLVEALKEARKEVARLVEIYRLPKDIELLAKIDAAIEGRGK